MNRYALTLLIVLLVAGLVACGSASRRSESRNRRR